MSLLTLRDICLSFGGPLLLKKISGSIEPRDRICLVGRNGEGKSTLIRVILKTQDVDSGEFESSPHLKLAFLPQNIPDSLTGTVFDIVSQGIGQAAATSAAYHQAALKLASNPEDTQAAEDLEKYQNELDKSNGWAVSHKIEKLLSLTELDPDNTFETLSGGLKRRVLLAQALEKEPDIL